MLVERLENCTGLKGERGKEKKLLDHVGAIKFHICIPKKKMGRMGNKGKTANFPFNTPRRWRRKVEEELRSAISCRGMKSIKKCCSFEVDVGAREGGGGERFCPLCPFSQYSSSSSSSSFQVVTLLPCLL